MPFYGSIVVIKRSGEDGNVFPLMAPKCVFGKSMECDIRIFLPNVSKKHCHLEVGSDNQIHLVPFKDSLPTELNSQIVNGKVSVSHSDVITISERSFRFEYPPNSRYTISNKSPSKTNKVVRPDLLSPTTPGTSNRDTHKTVMSAVIPSSPTHSPGKTPVKKIPSSQRKSSRKNVSFGPNLSPEQFLKKLPPSTPVHKGGVPKRRISAPDYFGSPIVMPLGNPKKKVVKSPTVATIQGSPRPQSAQVKSLVSTPTKGSPSPSQSKGKSAVESPAKKQNQISSRKKQRPSPLTRFSLGGKSTPKSANKRRSEAANAKQLASPKDTPTKMTAEAGATRKLSGSKATGSGRKSSRSLKGTPTLSAKKSRKSLSASPPGSVMQKRPTMGQTEDLNKLSPFRGYSPTKQVAVVSPLKSSFVGIDSLQSTQKFPSNVLGSPKQSQHPLASPNSPVSLILRLSPSSSSSGPSPTKLSPQKSLKKAPKFSLSPSKLNSTLAVPKINSPRSPDSRKSKALRNIHSSQFRTQSFKKDLKSRVATSVKKSASKLPNVVKRPLFSDILKRNLKTRPSATQSWKPATMRVRKPALKITSKYKMSSKKTHKVGVSTTGHAASPETIVIGRSKIKAASVVKTKKGRKTPHKVQVANLKTKRGKSGRLSGGHNLSGVAELLVSPAVDFLSKSQADRTLDITAADTSSISSSIFVSPLGTPGSTSRASTRKSPKRTPAARKGARTPGSGARLTGLRKLFQSPAIDVSDVELQFDSSEESPRMSKTSRRSAASDNKVSRGQTLFKSPEESFSRRSSSGLSKGNLTGVKKLFGSPRKSVPANYTDVVGVKKLFKSPSPNKSPVSDYTNVGGVKALFRRAAGSPRANYSLTDVQLEQLFNSPQGMSSNSSPRRSSPKKHLVLPVSVKSSVQTRSPTSSVSPNKVLPRTASPQDKLLDALLSKQTRTISSPLRRSSKAQSSPGPLTTVSSKTPKKGKLSKSPAPVTPVEVSSLPPKRGRPTKTPTGATPRKDGKTKTPTLVVTPTRDSRLSLKKSRTPTPDSPGRTSSPSPKKSRTSRTPTPGTPGRTSSPSPKKTRASRTPTSVTPKRSSSPSPKKTRASRTPTSVTPKRSSSLSPKKGNTPTSVTPKRGSGPSPKKGRTSKTPTSGTTPSLSPTKNRLSKSPAPVTPKRQSPAIAERTKKVGSAGPVSPRKSPVKPSLRASSSVSPRKVSASLSRILSSSKVKESPKSPSKSPKFLDAVAPLQEEKSTSPAAGRRPTRGRGKGRKDVASTSPAATASPKPRGRIVGGRARAKAVSPLQADGPVSVSPKLKGKSQKQSKSPSTPARSTRQKRGVKAEPIPDVIKKPDTPKTPRQDSPKRGTPLVLPDVVASSEKKQKPVATRRGRGRKADAGEVSASSPSVPEPKRRGRQPVKVEAVVSPEADTPMRGRKRKPQRVASPSTPGHKIEEPKQKSKSTRSKRATPLVSSPAAKPSPARGRKPETKADKISSTSSSPSPIKRAKRGPIVDSPKVQTPEATKKRGRGRQAKQPEVAPSPARNKRKMVEEAPAEEQSPDKIPKKEKTPSPVKTRKTRAARSPKADAVPTSPVSKRVPVKKGGKKAAGSPVREVRATSTPPAKRSPALKTRRAGRAKETKGTPVGDASPAETRAVRGAQSPKGAISNSSPKQTRKGTKTQKKQTPVKDSRPARTKRGRK